MDTYRKNENIRSRYFEMIRQTVLFIAMIVIMFIAVSNVNKIYQKQNLMIIKQSAQRAAVECYSVEGVYPPDIDYLVDNYSFTYNSDKYYIFYETFASNVMPTIEVYERK